VILGADSYLAERALERLLADVVGSDRSQSVETFDGGEASWSAVVDAARTGSLFVSRRAVLVRRAEAMKGEGEDVLAYLEAPNPGTLLVLLASKVDRRRLLWKRVLENAETIHAEPLKGGALRSYVRDELNKRKLDLSDEGLEELLEGVGQELRRVMTEIDKLEAFGHGSRKALSAEEVAEVMGRGLSPPLYRLGDALMRRRTAEVLQLTLDLLEEREAPLRILGTLQRSLRQVRGGRALRQAGAGRGEIVSRLGIPPFKVGDVLAWCEGWADADLAVALSALTQADLELKSGADPRTSLPAAVVRACGGKGGSARVSSRVP
jgi:DNA polymerase-3 subunit delta